LFGNLIEKAKIDPSKYVDLAFELEDMKQALANVETQQDPKTKAERTIKKPIKRDKPYTPNLCPEHPTYGGERVPSIDCEGHWAAYKKMNPLKYDQARRKYERNKKADS
jgi:hypothetical protein